MYDDKSKIDQMLEQLEEIFGGEAELSHMTGDIELCGKTADDVMRRIKERERK